jgi:hypothetical protein
MYVQQKQLERGLEELTVQLCVGGTLHEPVLYLSLFFKKHRQL